MTVKLEEKDVFQEDQFHIGQTVLNSNVITPAHTHDFYEIFIIEDGEVNHFVNGEQKVMRKGDLHFVRPEDEHYFQKGRCRKAQFVNLAFSKSLFRLVENILKQYFESEEKLERVEAHIPARMEIAILSKLAFVARERSNLFQVSQKDMVIGILLDCMIILDSQADNEENPPEWLEIACLEIKKHKYYVEGLEKFVELSGKSQEHLTRCMKKYYQITPTEYLNRIKLEHAAMLLETTEDHILDIMMDCGFNNVSHFNQLFKKNFGLTPSKYRALNYSVINPA